MKIVKNIFYILIGIWLLWGIVLNVVRYYELHKSNGTLEKCENQVKLEYNLINKATIEKICECSCTTIFGHDNHNLGVGTLDLLAKGVESYDHGNMIINHFDKDRFPCVTDALADAGISLYELSQMKK